MREILSKKGAVVHSVTPTTSVADAVRRMNEAGVGAVLVMMREEVVGILSERDVLVRVVDALRDPLATSVEEVMSTRLVTIGPDAMVQEGMRVMTEKRVRHLPVMEARQLMGIISIGDLTKAVVEDLQEEVVQLETYIAGPRF
ncbi:MAG: CBS domain-containing protein [Myxococcales bacterium]|nr:CBS domain-containing protein [Myxococcales bacterium]MCB9647383.1 CBS domain-containing protein [Deltaproteobacteria bacterium]